MRDLVFDVSSFQPDNLGFFQALKRTGGRAVIVKLTQGSRAGDNYINPKAANQIRNARKAHLYVHAYHFAKFVSPADAEEEARFFVDTAKRLGISKRRAMVVDVEPGGPSGQITKSTAAFIRYVHSHGYKRTAVYGPGSWFNGGILKKGSLVSNHYWVASYGVTQPGVSHTTMWQYTDSYPVYGLHVDASLDFTGYFSRDTVSAKKVAHKVVHKVKRKTPALPSKVKSERGTFYPNQTLRIWEHPGIGATGYKYHKGEKVHYRGYIGNGNYIYLCYLAKGGKKWHYVACRDRNTGKALGAFK